MIDLILRQVSSNWLHNLHSDLTILNYVTPPHTEEVTRGLKLHGLLASDTTSFTDGTECWVRLLHLHQPETLQLLAYLHGTIQVLHHGRLDLLFLDFFVLIIIHCCPSGLFGNGLLLLAIRLISGQLMPPDESLVFGIFVS